MSDDSDPDAGPEPDEPRTRRRLERAETLMERLVWGDQNLSLIQPPED